MDCHNFAGSWVHVSNFVGNWFVAFQSKTIHYFVKLSWGHKFVGNGNARTMIWCYFSFPGAGV